jgi:hypothetical protein
MCNYLKSKQTCRYVLIKKLQTRSGFHEILDLGITFTVLLLLLLLLTMLIIILYRPTVENRAWDIWIGEPISLPLHHNVDSFVQLVIQAHISIKAQMALYMVLWLPFLTHILDVKLNFSTLTRIQVIFFASLVQICNLYNERSMDIYWIDIWT